MHINTNHVTPAFLKKSTWSHHLLLCCPIISERFLDHHGQQVTPSSFLPFGAGPRVCVGKSLAILELFLFLSSLLQRMSFRVPHGAPLPNLQGRLGVVLQPLPFKVVVIPRAGWEDGGKWQSGGRQSGWVMRNRNVNCSFHVISSDASYCPNKSLLSLVFSQKTKQKQRKK